MNTRIVTSAWALVSALLLLTTVAPEARTQPLLGSARNSALARSNISETLHLETMHENPATLAFEERRKFLFNHRQGNDELPMSEQLTLTAMVVDRGAIALGGAVSNPRNASPKDRAGLFRYVAEIGVGYELLQGLGIGVSAAGSRILGPDIRYEMVATTVGLVYAPLETISYAAVYRQSGPFGTASSEGIPQGYLPDSGRSIRIGIAMRYPSPLSMRRPFLVLALTNEKILDREGLIYRGGLEIFPVDFFALRAGYVLGGDIDRPTFGAGLIFGMVQVDYVYSRESSQAGIHEASIAVVF